VVAAEIGVVAAEKLKNNGMPSQIECESPGRHLLPAATNCMMILEPLFVASAKGRSPPVW